MSDEQDSVRKRLTTVTALQELLDSGHEICLSKRGDVYHVNATLNSSGGQLGVSFSHSDLGKSVGVVHRNSLST